LVCEAITMLLIIAHESPKIITIFQEIHESNKKQHDEFDELKTYLFDASKPLSFPEKLIYLIRR